MGMTGVKQRLYAGFAVVTLITVISCFIGLYLFDSFDERVEHLSAEQVPSMQLVLLIAKESQRVGALISLLQNPDKSPTHLQHLGELKQQWITLQQLSEEFSALQIDHPGAINLLLRSELIEALLAGFGDLQNTLVASVDASKRAENVAAGLEQQAVRLSTSLEQRQHHLESLVNTQIYSQPADINKLRDSHERYGGIYQFNNAAHRLHLILVSDARGNPTSLDKAQALSETLLRDLEKQLRQLETEILPDATAWYETLAAATTSETGVYGLRKAEFVQAVEIQSILKRHREIADGLMRESEKWARSINSDIDRAARELDRRVDSYRLLLIFATLAFLALVFGVIWLYVGRSIILPLIKTSHAMNAIASGHTETPIPRFGEGEIGLMLKSLARLKAYVVQVQNQAQRDGLTGLYNRRQFDECLERELRRAIREQTPFSLIIADIDHFKRFNDSYGHIAGDNCLKDVAQVLHRQFNRASDLTARYGGEEFAVILPATTASSAELLADGLVAQAEALKIPHGDSPTSSVITLSAGVITLTPRQEHTPQVLIDMADKALYRAKERGRNRVVHQVLTNPPTKPV